MASSLAFLFGVAMQTVVPPTAQAPLAVPQKSAPTNAPPLVAPTPKAGAGSKGATAASGLSPTSTTPTTASAPSAASPSSSSPMPTWGDTTDSSRRVITLEEAERTAAHYQPLLRQARATTSAARARIEEARSGALPQITGTGQYQLTTGNFAPTPGVTTSSATATTSGSGVMSTGSATTHSATSFDLFNFYNFGLSASQLIYDFNQTRGKWRAAESSADSYRLTEMTTENQTRFSVHSAFFQARAQKALVKVATDTLANQMKHMGQIQAFVEVGTHPAIDLASVRTDVANAQLQLITAQNAYDVAKVQLNQAMGVMNDINFDVADETMPPLPEEDWPLDRLLKKAYDARPELASLTKGREAQEYSVEAAKGGYGPTIQATGSATERGIALDSLVPNVSVGVLVTWPLLQGGLTRGLVHEAEANLNVVDAQVDAEKLQIKLDVEQAYLAVRAAKASIQASQDALLNSRDQLRLAEGRYGSGIGNVVELGDAQVALTSASAQRVQNDFTLSTARAQLLEALGQR